MSKRQYTEEPNRTRRGSAVGWIVLVLLCLVAAGIIYLRGTVDREDSRPEENPAATETAAPAQAAENPVMPAAEPAAVTGAENTVDSTAAGSTQSTSATPAPKNEPPIWFPASGQTTQTTSETAAGSAGTQSSSAAAGSAATPAPAAPVPTASAAPAQQPTPTPVQNSTDSGSLNITLEENELPLF